MNPYGLDSPGLLRLPVLAVLLAMFVVTYLPNMLPLTILSRFTLPPWLVRWLRYVPAALVTTVLTQVLVLPGGRLSGPLENLGLLAVLPAILVAVRTRSQISTVLTGVIAIALLRLWLE